MRKERPDLEEAKDRLVMSISNDKKQLQDLEDKVCAAHLIESVMCDLLTHTRQERVVIVPLSAWQPHSHITFYRCLPCTDPEVAQGQQGQHPG